MNCYPQLAIVLAISLTALPFAQAAPQVPAPNKDAYLRIAAEVEKSLLEDDFEKFFPAAVDAAGGGFFENFSEDWTHTSPAAGRRAAGAAPAGADPVRSVVYQARLTWMSAQAALRYPDQVQQYLKFTRHGAKFLMERQWDQDQGGFWWSVDSTGVPRGDSKHVYGNAFAIYALATSYKATHDAAALGAAKAGFHWLEAHSHDANNGGYYEQLVGDGSHQTGMGNDVVGARSGQKSMNSHIHILEAFSALLEVWPDALVKKRTEEVYQLNLTKIYAEPGRLHMFLQADWTPMAGRDSYGHDIEAAFLFADAAAALGKPDDPACWRAGRNIVDHCLQVAYDPRDGALYSEGTVDGRGDIGKARVWWVEAESLNALLLMHERFGKDDPRYWNAFVKQWNFIRDHQIDHVNGGWYNTLGPDNTPLRSKMAKTDAWTEGYHQGRAMLNVTERLKKLAGQ